MSGIGNILPYLNPNLLAAQRRQAIAQMLLQRGSQEPNQKNPYSGLTDAGNMMLGAYLLKRSDKDMSSAYQNMMGMGGNAPDQNASPSPPQGPAPAMAPGGDMFASPGSSAPMTPVSGSAPPQPTPTGMATPSPPQQGGSVMGNLLDQMVPPMPGTTPMMRLQAAQSPDLLKTYYDNYLKYNAPTDAMKQVAAGLHGGMDNPQFAATMAAMTAKGLQTTVGAGAGVMGPNNSLQFAMPTRLGPTPTQPQGPGSPVGLSMPAGSAAALAQATGAQNLAKQATNPSPFVTPQGTFVPGTAAQAAGQGGTAQGLGIPQPNIGGGAMPAPPLGAGAGASTQATAVVNRSQGYQQAANQTNIANNILDNMNELVSRGLKPGMSEWQQEMLRWKPELETLLGKPVDVNNPAVLADIFNKFSNQYQLAQSAGIGASSTDALRATIGHANPNIEQFGPALKQIIPWLKSVNVGIRAQNNYLHATGGNPAVDPNSYQQAENHFTNIYDPLMSQMAMQPNTPQGNIVRSQILSHVPQDKRASFLTHYKELIPYFRSAQ